MALKKLKGVKKTIGTIDGQADYIGTEIENTSGNWNNNYYTRDGYWVIHKGKKHHVYETTDSISLKLLKRYLGGR